MKTIGIAKTINENGYWFAQEDGSISIFGNANFYGSLLSQPLNKPIVGIEATPDGQGYWLTAADGGVFTFGNAGFFGSMGGQPLNKPVVGIASTPDGQGYWLAAADGGVFTFGNAGFFGSISGQPLNEPIVGVASTPDGQGYWLTAADGGVFTFGNAGFFGSISGQQLNEPIVGIAITPDGQGYWLTAADGGVFTFGNAGFFGSMGGQPLNKPIVGIRCTHDGQGYWLIAADGGVFTFGNAGFWGSGLISTKEVSTCVILCRFRNSDSSLTPIEANQDFYSQFFFGRNVGGSLRDYYYDVTHSHIDIVGDVFNWLDIGHTISEHKSVQNQAQRFQAFNWGIQAAINAGIDVNRYSRKVVIINQDTDWGGVRGNESMLLPHTPITKWSHSRAAHEFGHVLGLYDAYSTTKTSTEIIDTVYFDQHCIMSYATRGSRFNTTFIGQDLEAGPGLNGVYTHMLGGIPTSKFCEVPAIGTASTIKLAPLTHAEIEGALLVKIPPTQSRPNTYWVELHDKSKWDSAIPGTRIAIHETRTGDPRSYSLEINGQQSLKSILDPAFVTPDGTIGIRYIKKDGLNVFVRIWEMGPEKTNNVRIASINYNPLGEDYLGEYVILRNDKLKPVNLKNWKIRDNANHPKNNPWQFIFPEIVIYPGEDLIIWTKSGKNNSQNIYWGLSHSIWNNQGGDIAILTNESGVEISRFEY